MAKKDPRKAMAPKPAKSSMKIKAKAPAGAMDGMGPMGPAMGGMGMKKGGMCKGYAKGGSIDGIAKKGRTKCKIS